MCYLYKLFSETVGSKWYHLKGRQEWYKATEYNLACAVMLPFMWKADLMNAVRANFQAPGWKKKLK